MSAIAFADQLSETRRGMSEQREELEKARSEIERQGERRRAWALEIAAGLDQASERIERAARTLNAAGKE